MMPDEAIDYCSSVVVGEAETIWSQVLRDFENGCLKKKYVGVAADLSKIPIPNRKYFKNDKYLWGTILTSKGCPMNCSFCSVTKFNGHKFRRRPVDSVIDELLTIKHKFVMIVDDNLVGYDDKSWLSEFFNKIIELKIKKYFFIQSSIKFGQDVSLIRLAYRAGVRIVLLGIESNSVESLAKYNKNLNIRHSNSYFDLFDNIRKNGIGILGCFILGCDCDTKESFPDTLNFILKAKIDVLQISKPTPLPGTDFYSELDKENRIIDKNYPNAWSDYKFTRMLFKPTHLSINDVNEGINAIKNVYYKKYQLVKRILNTLIDTKSLTTTMVVMLFNHTYMKSWKNSDLYSRPKMSSLTTVNKNHIDSINCK